MLSKIQSRITFHHKYWMDAGLGHIPSIFCSLREKGDLLVVTLATKVALGVGGVQQSIGISPGEPYNNERY